MYPELQDQALRAAQAAARRLLLRAIDLRFNLDDTAEAIETGDPIGPVELQRLRADADAVRDEVERLAEALWPSRDGASGEDEDLSEAAAAAHGE